MSNLPGNPHAAIAHRAKNLNAMARGDGEDRPDLLVRMQAEATLALAYEQRTANLIAAYGTSDLIEFDTILARLGLLDGAK